MVHPLGEGGFRRVSRWAKGDSPRDSGQKRRKHVGSPHFAESAFFGLNDGGAETSIRRILSLLGFKSLRGVLRASAGVVD